LALAVHYKNKAKQMSKLKKISNYKLTFLTREQMIEVDRIAIEETGPNLWQMMENAGRNLAELTIKLANKDWKQKEIIVLAGKGNNGGGGICAARHLMNHSAKVKLILADEDNLGEVPNYQKRVYESAGGNSFSLSDLDNFQPDLIIDAIIGYNLKGAPNGNLKQMIMWANSKKVNIISLDIPSGIDSNTGEAPGEFINAFATLTLALPKTGLQNDKVGRLFLGDIGIPKKVYNEIGVNFDSPFKKKYIVEIINKQVGKFK
jgi:NAD(P)H-hydrate epimerase